MGGDGVDMLREGLAALAAEDVDGRFMGDDLVGLAALIGCLQAQFSRRVEVFDAQGDACCDGHRSTVGWLSANCRMDPGDASREVRAARMLRAVPSVRELWETGATTSAHVSRLARVRHLAKADREFDALAPVWAELCAEHDTKLLGNVLASFMDRVDNTRPAEDQQAAGAIARRMLAGSKCLGVGLLDARLDGLDFETVWDAIEHEREAGWVQDDERTIDQQRADALVAICKKVIDGLDPTTDNPTNVSVIVTDKTLAGLEAGLCETDTGLALSVEVVRRLCCNAEIGRILINPDGEIVNLGRTRRLFNRAQRRAMHYRDRGCCFPGCTRHARQCEAHHIDPWQPVGPTDLDNGALLCWTHHRLVHDLHWTISRTSTGGIEWRRPDQTYYGTWTQPGLPPPIPINHPHAA